MIFYKNKHQTDNNPNFPRPVCCLTIDVPFFYTNILTLFSVFYRSTLFTHKESPMYNRLHFSLKILFHPQKVKKKDSGLKITTALFYLMQLHRPSCMLLRNFLLPEYKYIGSHNPLLQKTDVFRQVRYGSSRPLLILRFHRQ